MLFQTFVLGEENSYMWRQHNYHIPTAIHVGFLIVTGAYFPKQVVLYVFV